MAQLTRSEIYQMGLTCAQLGIESVEELSRTLTLGKRIEWHLADIEALNLSTRAILRVME